MQLEIGAVFAAGQTRRMGRRSDLHVVRIAVGVAVSRGAGLHLREHLAAFLFVRPEYGNGYCRILRSIGRKGVAVQNEGQRLRVVHVFDIYRIGERGAVLVVAIDRNDLVKPVDAQLEGWVDIDADDRGGGEIRVVPAPARQQYEQAAGQRGDKPHPAGPMPTALCLAGEVGARLFFQILICVDLVKRRPDLVMHRPHLPVLRAAAAWRGPAACKPY